MRRKSWLFLWHRCWAAAALPLQYALVSLLARYPGKLSIRGICEVLSARLPEGHEVSRCACLRCHAGKHRHPDKQRWSCYTQADATTRHRLASDFANFECALCTHVLLNAQAEVHLRRLLRAALQSHTF